MSETLKFSSKEIKSWLEKETASLFVPIHSRARKLVDEMRKTLSNLAELSKMLLENSGKEIDKKNMKTFNRARALNKLAKIFFDRMRQVKIPENVTYDSFNEFVLETQRAFLVTEVDIRNWFPRISPFFILDRRKFQTAFDKAKEQLKEMSTFLAKEYVKAKTLEQTFQLIDKLMQLEQQTANLQEQKAKVENSKTQVLTEIAAVESRMAELKASGSLSQLNQVKVELENVSNEVKQSLHHLQKPFVKLQALSLHGGGSGLTPDQVGKLSQYIESPFEAFATEPPNLPLLKEIIQKTAQLMSEGKLQLKPEKTRKAQQLIAEILENNSLSELHKRSSEIIARKNRLASSAEVALVEKELLKCKEQLEALEIRRKVIEGEQTTVERAFTETSEKIRQQKAEIERNVFSVTNRKIRVE